MYQQFNKKRALNKRLLPKERKETHKMESKGAAPTQVYEDFVPTTELVQEQDSDTLLLNLTGFKKEQVRVQLTKTGVLKISGQRPAGQNKWLRFQKDFPVSENCDKSKISAKFENGILYVKQPKLITSVEKKEKESPTPAAQQPKKPEQDAQKKDEENAKSEKTTPREELPKQEPKIPSPEIKQSTEAKMLPEKAPAEKTGTSSTTEDGKRTNYDSKIANDAKMGAAALAEKLRMPRKILNMTLVAIVVLGIGLYVSKMMKSNSYQSEE